MISESALEKLRQKVIKKEVERKTKALKKEYIEKERVEHIWLIGAIYVEPLASRALTA